MYSATSLLAGAPRHGDAVMRVQRAALALAMMLSSSNVSPMTTIVASLLFAVLAGWARAHVWTHAKKTFPWPHSRTPALEPRAEIVRCGPALAGAHRRTPMHNGSMIVDMQRLCATLACASHVLCYVAPAQRIT